MRRLALPESNAAARRMRKKLGLTLATIALLAALFVGPERLREFLFPAPLVPGAWHELLTEVRAFERRMGFRDTANFKVTADHLTAYTLCGYAPRLQLPYSYEDR